MIKFDPMFGIYSLEIPFVPTPKELLRRAALLELIDTYNPGYTIDVGCGAGAYLYDLSQKGFNGIAIDTSHKALSIAKSLSQLYKSKFNFVSDFSLDEINKYDYVLAFELIEHIIDDRNIICKFNKLLKTKGKLIISVPAHKNLWSKHDEWAGHYRRYDRSDLTGLLQNEGFRVLKIFCYGFPIMNILLPIRIALAYIRIYSNRKNNNFGIKDATNRSGYYRTIWPKIHWFYLSWFTKYFWKFAYNVQRNNFYNEKGEGYLVAAEKID